MLVLDVAPEPMVSVFDVGPMLIVPATEMPNGFTMSRRSEATWIRSISYVSMFSTSSGSGSNSTDWLETFTVAEVTSSELMVAVTVT